MAFKIPRPRKGATLIKHGRSGGTGFVKEVQTKTGMKVTNYNYKGKKRKKQ